jgi:hypothetical protein
VSALKSEGTVPSRGYEVPDFVRRFLRYAVEGHEEAATIGRALVLVINNEDILRTLHHIIKEIEDPTLEPDAIRETYHGLFDIMQDYRRICTGQKESELEIKGKFATISRERREVEEIAPMLTEAIYKTPILGRKIQHTLLEDTENHLRKGNLQHLNEIWPISTNAQEIFNTVCRLEEKLPEDPDIQFNHLLFQEKIYEFLMRLERLGIGVVKDSRIPIITNAFQLNSLNLIRKGLYLGSTGCWQCPNQIPPSVICCTNPHAINNCLGHRMRHIFLRVFLGTGEFYESPFILDSTSRYGSVDEEGLVDGLVIRPGLFLIEIPQEIRDRWVRVEEVQLSTALEKRINTRIAMENTGTFIMSRA